MNSFLKSNLKLERAMSLRVIPKISPNYLCTDLAAQNLFFQVFCLMIHFFILKKAFFTVTKNSKTSLDLFQTSSSSNHYFSLRLCVDHLHVLTQFFTWAGLTCNSQKLGKNNEVFTNWWMVKQNVMYLLKGRLFSHKEKIDSCYNVDETWKHYVKWKNQDRKNSCIVWFYLY